MNPIQIMIFSGKKTAEELLAIIEEIEKKPVKNGTEEETLRLAYKALDKMTS